MGGFDAGSRINSGSQIDNVQSFAEIIGDNDDFWNLLVGKEVSRFNQKVK